MNDEQRVDIKLGERTFSFSIPADEFIPFGKAKKKIEKLLEEINVPEEKLDHALVQIALKFAIEYEIKNEDLSSDSEIKLFFKDALRLNSLNFEEEGYRYFLSVSHGWKKNKSEPYKVNNFKGLLIDSPIDLSPAK